MKDTIDVAVRRSPKYPAFIVVGIVLGMVAGGILGLLPVDTSELTQQFNRGSAVWLIMVVLGIVGGFLGAIVALILDRRSIKKATTYRVAAEYREVRRHRPAAAPADPAQPDNAAAVDPAHPDRVAPEAPAAGTGPDQGGPATASGTNRDMGE
ncbi:hypothetical protein GCM10022261_07430 [Brevibacterium daeguense]|uniref:Uncharacterized protein n=1 Tax=Brevibacterium daeguense TaxID=909936 RepID=A0ABP8EGZ6_9MICO